MLIDLYFLLFLVLKVNKIKIDNYLLCTISNFGYDCFHKSLTATDTEAAHALFYKIFKTMTNQENFTDQEHLKGIWIYTGITVVEHNLSRT